MQRGIISHIEIYVSNLQNSAKFWGWFLSELGYQVHQEWRQGISWKLEQTYFVLVQVSKEHLMNSYHRKNIGLNHLAFHAHDTRDVDQMTIELKERGITILYSDRHPYAGGSDSYAVFFEDPDRIKVEFTTSPLQ